MAKKKDTDRDGVPDDSPAMVYDGKKDLSLPFSDHGVKSGKTKGKKKK